MTASARSNSYQPLAATAIVGLGTLVSLGTSVIANKVYASVLGPPGVGIAGLILSTVTVGAVAAGVGLATSIGQVVSASMASGHGRTIRLAEHVARRITLGTATVTAIVIVILRESLALWIFGDSSRGPYMFFIAASIVLTALAYLETGILTGHQRVRDIAIANALAAAIGAAVGVAGVLSLGIDGLAPAVLISSGFHYLIVRFRTRRLTKVAGDETEARRVASPLIRLGVPASVSQLLAVGAQLIVPVAILHDLGEHEVGLYRAASTISIGYLTLVLSTLSYEFLPRFARLRPDELGAGINQHMRMLLGGAVPLILLLFAIGPLLLDVLFAREFGQAMSVLQWQLVGDLLRLPAWALAYALMARGRGATFLTIEATAGGFLILIVPIGLRLGGLEGVGVAYAVTQVVYLAAAWSAAARLGVAVPGRLQGVVVLTAIVLSASIVLGVPLAMRGVVFGLMAMGLAAIAIPRLYALRKAGAI